MDEKLFGLMTKTYEEIKEMRSDIQCIKQDVSDVKVDIVTNQDLIELEDKVVSKLDTLLDVMESDIDRKTDLVTTLKDINRKVEKIELDLIRYR